MFRAFRRAPSGIFGLATILIIVLTALLAPIFLYKTATIVDVFNANKPPSAQHLLGTDQLGHDILARILVATRSSMTTALLAIALAALIGFPLGASAAVVGPRARPFILRLIDTLLSFPGIIIAIFVVAIVGPGATGATIGVGIALSFGFARVVSTLALSVGGREYVTAARVVGVRPGRLLLRYILPNIAETLIIAITVAISEAIVTISALSFLGLGVQPPAWDWGQMLTQGVQELYEVPVAAMAPVCAIAISALAFGYTGEALARAMNPTLWAADVPAGRRTIRNGRRVMQRAQAASANLKGMDVDQTDDGTVLVAKNLTVRLLGMGKPLTVVDDVSFVLRKGEMLGIVGESGSGKTMTMMAISQLVPYPAQVDGALVMGGHDIMNSNTKTVNSYLGTHLSIVFQDPMSSLNPALKIGRQLTEAVRVHSHLKRRHANGLAADRLGEVNMPTPKRQLTRYPHELSGGMRQRVMIAMGLMNEPMLLIADEPTTALDVTIQAQIMEVLGRIHASRDTGVILISHNLALVSQVCQRVLVMYAGRVVEELSVAQLRSDPLHPYTRALLESVPDMDSERTEALKSIPGQAPDLGALPPGCPFNPRCPLVIDKCLSERPPLMTARDGRLVACWVALGEPKAVRA